MLQTTDALSLIQQIQEKEYKIVAGVTKAVGLLQDYFTKGDNL
jgi:hypothetical protein